MGSEAPQRKGYAVCVPTTIMWQRLPSESRQLMNAPSDLSMKTDDVLRVELAVFKREHRDLDDAIHALVEKGTADQLTLQRLKKRKLLLKDMIARIEDRLTPDIIA